LSKPLSLWLAASNNLTALVIKLLSKQGSFPENVGNYDYPNKGETLIATLVKLRCAYINVEDGHS